MQWISEFQRCERVGRDWKEEHTIFGLGQLLQTAGQTAGLADGYFLIGRQEILRQTSWCQIELAVRRDKEEESNL